LAKSNFSGIKVLRVPYALMLEKRERQRRGHGRMGAARRQQ
jgi:hypothetical protein